jgi:ribonuclease HI
MQKINVNAALSKNTEVASAAAMARDAVGNFLGASAFVLESISDPKTMEVLACREGLSLAMDLNLQRFRLACDSKNVIRSLSGMSMGAYGHVVHEIKARANVFVHSEFVHENRASNVDAHVLARSSIYAHLGRHIWFLESPHGICSTCTFTHL